jgi:putative inorganic carbon (HCO3(-)) transporter
VMQVDRRRRWPEYLAIAGVGLVVTLVPMVQGRISIGPVPVDAVIITVPLAILASLPLLWRDGLEWLDLRWRQGPALLFMFAALLSVLASGDRVSSFMTFLRYASYLALAVSVAGVARHDPRRRQLIWLVAGAGAITFVHAAFQWVSPTIGIGMGGLPEAVATRVFATFGNPNFYAEYLVLLFAVILYLILSEDGWRRRLAEGLLLGAAGFLLLTYTRGSWLALVLGLIVAMGMISRRYAGRLLAMGVALTVVIPGGLERLLSTFSMEGTASFRLRLWRIAGEAIKMNPLLGAGAGEYYSAFTEAVRANPILGIGYYEYGAHNTFLTLIAEVGVLGGIAFTWLVFVLVRQGLLLQREGFRDRTLGLQNAAITAGLIAFAINGFTSNAFQHPQAAVFFWVLVGVQVGIAGGANSTEACAAAHTGVGEGLKVSDGSVVVRSWGRCRSSVRSMVRGSTVVAACRVMQVAAPHSGSVRVVRAVWTAAQRGVRASHSGVARLARGAFGAWALSTTGWASGQAIRGLSRCWTRSFARRVLFPSRCAGDGLLPRSVVVRTMLGIGAGRDG